MIRQSRMSRPSFGRCLGTPDGSSRSVALSFVKARAGSRYRFGAPPVLIASDHSVDYTCGRRGTTRCTRLTGSYCAAQIECPTIQRTVKLSRLRKFYPLGTISVAPSLPTDVCIFLQWNWGCGVSRCFDSTDSPTGVRMLWSVRVAVASP
jgi:hypothetical protein